MARGRPSKNLGPVVTTTVRIPVDEWRWVKERRAEFSALLRKAIRKEMEREEVAAATLIVQENRRKRGLPIVGPAPPATEP